MENEDLSAEFVARRHELFSFTYALVRNVQDSEDIVQEVWLRFSSALERGIQIEKTAQWTRGTAKNLILHYWRKKGNATVTADSELLDLVELAFSEGDDDSEKELWQIRREALTECVQTLPDDSQRLISLRYDEGNPVAKIAEVVERSEGSVMMALSRIRRLLQSCVDTKLKARGA
jgi:RNA polymerase sigma-70 factor, ECF subfamily